ncbi:hypothetical protein L1987_56111 [Smallanthus sonchifolius]|uniref:Uncharacterized protein n=1 Tax=Smallanthus sonchifolius TaxID=185202 RepID=A0ACB9EC40_9ASTR|nr:hypothetical protein L1987_56111 [Smallanthus sonchifolius]
MDNIQSVYDSDEERNHITHTGAPTGDSQPQAGTPMVSSLKDRLAQAPHHPADLLPATATASHLHTSHTNLPTSLPPLIPNTMPTQVTRDIPQPAIFPSFPQVTHLAYPFIIYHKLFQPLPAYLPYPFLTPRLFPDLSLTPCRYSQATNGGWNNNAGPEWMNNFGRKYAWQNSGTG